MTDDTTVPHRAAIEGAQLEATRLWHAARAAPWAPTNAIDAVWEGFKHKTKAAMPGPVNENSAAEQESRRQLLRIAREAQDAMKGFINMPPADRERVWARDRDNAIRAQYAASQAHIAMAAPQRPQWAPAEFIRQMAQRGIRLSTTKGAILASPASLLTAADLDVLRSHKGAIVEALNDAQVVA